MTNKLGQKKLNTIIDVIHGIAKRSVKLRVSKHLLASSHVTSANLNNSVVSNILNQVLKDWNPCNREWSCDVYLSEIRYSVIIRATTKITCISILKTK